MDSIIKLENELKENKAKLLKERDNTIYRALLLERSALKDKLLVAYRNEMSVRIVDDYTGDAGSF